MMKPRTLHPPKVTTNRQPLGPQNLEPVRVLIQRLQEDVGALREELVSLAARHEALRAQTWIDDAYAVRLCGGRGRT